MDTANKLESLRNGSMPCPFCETEAMNLFPSETGPVFELTEGNLSTLGDAPVTMTHLVYCGKEDREFNVVYRPAIRLPACPDCESDYDVIADPPPNHYKLVASFFAQARCALCELDLGTVAYEAFDIRDEGTRGS